MQTIIPLDLADKIEFSNGDILLNGELDNTQRKEFEEFYVEFMQEKWMRFCSSDISYDSICEKLGFDIDTYEIPVALTEDANGESPFRRLTVDELDFIIERRRIQEEFKYKFEF